VGYWTNACGPGRRSNVLGVTFSTVEGPKLRITWDGGSADA